ncbi:MAG: agmatinase [Thermoanaerobacteraceae bacterium]|uniref:Agmatinase n=1 Tax=Biomaibacter acetigenes TaxID=2316383 RepID=A0A3G2R545_9FIRM|nr:agmatinase [Biomaibacter acetigenes]AYO30654.1 agmatinase [Biomaibacter acetigenes]MDK2879698.1 agmatinase [Thermoanaerobacteraceae bacterium]MDN5300729.1 agmatinase [Thermoanaerobacteraceae bacterium]RKL64164.1 agmatinase [Thermoanaerobacteraceae bacterium SP2]
MEHLMDQGKFLRAKQNYDVARTVIVGVPMDFTVSFRPGTRMGPRKIREVSYGLEDYSIYADDSLNDKEYFDAGDVDIPFGNVEKSLEIIEQVTVKLLDNNKIPVFLGGEHLISYPIIKQVAKKYEDLVVVHFDAHADLRDTFFGERLSHATVLRRVCEHIRDKHLYQFGIRSGIKEEFNFAKEHTHMNPINVKKPFMETLEELKQKPVYVTLDIDVVDPAFAPGTGTPEPGGCSSQDILDVVSSFKDLNIVGFDLVEVSPASDLSERTSLLAAKILREVLIAIC